MPLPSLFSVTVECLTRFRVMLLFSIMVSSIKAVGPVDILPPIQPWNGASEALIAKPDNAWITPSEKMGLTNTPSYEETIAYLQKLVAASPFVSLREFGRTAEGRPLYLVVASKEKVTTSQAIRASGKPSLLAQAGIHAGEIDGKDAGLMLLRDLAFGGKSALLDKAHFLFVPVFNADGHARSSEWSRPNQRGPVHQGWRTTAQNVNLNRDYMKADSPEMQALLKLLNEYSPSLYLDLHVTDGMDYQYDITFGYNGDAGVFAWSTRIASWLNTRFRPETEAALKAAGHIPGELVFEQDDRDLSKGLFAGTSMPRYSNGYGDLRRIPTILIENHSLKPYRQRVLGTYVLLESSLRTLGNHANELQNAIKGDIASAPARIPMNWGIETNAGSSARDFLGIAYETFVSPASGATEVRWLGTRKIYPRLAVALDKAAIQLHRPKAYWVPVSKPEVIQRLKLHGIQMEISSNFTTLPVEMYRLIDPKANPVRKIHPFEGRHTMKTGVRLEKRTETFAPGSARVSTGQPLGELAMVLLEPESNDSFFAWGFFLELLQRTEYIEGYVMAPIAEQMLGDPKVKSEFEATLAVDPEFAASPSLRLQWFYQRTKFYDDRYLLYPIAREP